MWIYLALLLSDEYSKYKEPSDCKRMGGAEQNKGRIKKKPSRMQTEQAPGVSLEEQFSLSQEKNIYPQRTFICWS